jgi:hypothetical protein
MKKFARAVIAGTLMVFGLIGPSAAAQVNAGHGHPATNTAARKKVKVKLTIHRAHGLPSVAGSAGSYKSQAGDTCLPPILSFDRLGICWLQTYELVYTETENGEPVASETYHFGIETQISLSATSTAFTTVMIVVNFTEAGDAPELVPSITMSAGCGHPCQITAPQIVAIGDLPDDPSGAAANSVEVSSGHIARPKPAYGAFAEVGGAKSNAVAWPILTAARCDHMYPTSWRKPGCVLPAVIPTVDMSSLKTIAKNIRKVQGRGSHVGKPGGRNPLNRTTSQQEADDNRKLVCPKHLKRPPGSQCDEYPFASSWQGGKKLPPIDRIIGWVPAHENRLQGAILKNFYKDNRVLRGSPGDAFYVNA